MLNLLVAIDHSLEASFALRTACLFGPKSHIRPIYIFEPPGRDLSFGAGWAWKSWERETSRQAEGDIEDLLLAERDQCPNIDEPVVLTGEPVQGAAEYFWQEGYDLLVIGSPFRGMGPLALCRRLRQSARKIGEDIAVLVVRRLTKNQRVAALTDGSNSAEGALGLLVRITISLPYEITLFGLGRPDGTSSTTEALNLERGLAILKERGIDAAAYQASALLPDRLFTKLKEFDLVVVPYLQDIRHNPLQNFLNEEAQAVLFYIGED
jgi:hypothetical protein